MRDTELAEIRKLPLFRSMDEDNFLTLMQAAYDQTFPAQVQLIEQSGAADFLHVVMEGSVELFAAWQGHETTMAVVQPVTTFILAACIQDAPYLMSARTLERTRVVMVPSVDLRAIFLRDPNFAQATIAELAACYRSVVRHTKNLKLRTARERLAAYILGQIKSRGSGAGFTLSVEKRLLASYLGVTPESLSRLMKSLQDCGVHIEGQRITLTDPSRLAEVAKPCPLVDGPDFEEASVGLNLPDCDQGTRQRLERSAKTLSRQS